MLDALEHLWNEPHGRSALLLIAGALLIGGLVRFFCKGSPALAHAPSENHARAATAIGHAFWTAFAPRLPFLLTFCGLSLGISEALIFFKIGTPDSEASLLSLCMILAASMAARAAIKAVEYALLLRYDLKEPLQPEVRSVVTRVQVLRKIVNFLVIIIAAAAALMLFPPVRNIGQSILASAGLAGIIVGLASQRTLSNLFAGIQLALTQPIRLGDVVQIEGETGTVEEITLTYVVLRLADLRGLVLPISYFLEKPFQNWSRSASGKLIALVTILLDYQFAVPLEVIRTKAREFTAASPHWDQDKFELIVTNLNRDSVELRISASANSPGACWNLRCELREKMLNYLKTEHPESLPRPASS